MIKRRLSTILTLIFLTAFVGYFFSNLESFRPLLGIPLVSLVLITLIKTLRYVSNGLFMQWTVEVFTKKLSLAESVYVAVLSAIGNFFGPLFGGAAIRAVYLKKVHKLSYSFFTSTLAGYYVILFAISSLLGIISLLFLEKSTFSTSLLTFFIAWFLVMVAMMFVRLPRHGVFASLETRKFLKFIIDVVYDIEKGWRQITRRKGLLAKLSLLGIGGFVLTFITTYIEFQAIGVYISPAALGLYTAISSATILISLTPGAIGIKEGLLILTSPVMGITNVQVLQVAVIDRGITFLLLVLLYAAAKLTRTRAYKRITE